MLYASMNQEAIDTLLVEGAEANCNALEAFNVSKDVKRAAEYVRQILIDAISFFKDRCKNKDLIGYSNFIEFAAIDVLMHKINETTSTVELANALTDAFMQSEYIKTDFNYEITDEDCAVFTYSDENTVNMVNDVFRKFYFAHRNDRGIKDFMMCRAIRSVDTIIDVWKKSCDADDIRKELKNDYKDITTRVSAWRMFAKVEYVDILENFYKKHMA